MHEESTRICREKIYIMLWKFWSYYSTPSIRGFSKKASLGLNRKPYNSKDFVWNIIQTGKKLDALMTRACSQRKSFAIWRGDLDRFLSRLSKLKNYRCLLSFNGTLINAEHPLWTAPNYGTWKTLIEVLASAPT